jgi:hypothetical protein
VIVLPETSAVVTGAEKMSVLVLVPLTSASFVYVLLLVSVTFTVPAVAGFIAKVTMTVFPTATPPDGTVTLMLVLLLAELFCPMFVGVPITTI